jgi:hypothetical protein
MSEATKEKKALPVAAADEKGGLLRFQRIGYRVDANGVPVPVDREVQEDFSRFIRGVIADANKQKMPAPR